MQGRLVSRDGTHHCVAVALVVEVSDVEPIRPAGVEVALQANLVGLCIGWSSAT
jgi:hypothetical protein